MQKEILYRATAPILLLGETGVGKTHLARQIHNNSVTKGRSFISVNVAALNETIFASELFGHTKGAFTDAVANKKGYCDMVGTGTLFLDEIGDLSLNSQKVLLSFLDEKSYSPVGSCQPKKFVGRIIAATNAPLEQKVKEGTFRNDLYHRLRVFSYEITPLRKKNEVILPLFKELFKRLTGFSVGLTKDCEKKLNDYSWPGNIRELKNLVEYTAVLKKRILSQEDLPLWFSQVEQKKENQGVVFYDTYRESLENFESKYLDFMLRKYAGMVTKTALAIGMSKGTFISKIKKYDINAWKVKGEVGEAVGF